MQFPDYRGFLDELLAPVDSCTGNSRLHSAALCGVNDILVEILNHIPTNLCRYMLTDNNKNENVLHLLCERGNARALTQLLDIAEPSDLIKKLVDVKDCNGHSAFHRACAAEIDEPSLITTLLQKK